MESGLFILDAIVIVVAILMSLRDDRAGPEESSNSYFRYAEAVGTAPEPGRRGRNRSPPTREGRSSRIANALAAASQANAPDITGRQGVNRPTVRQRRGPPTAV